MLLLKCYSGRAYGSDCWGLGFEVGKVELFRFFMLFCNHPLKLKY